MRRSSAMAVSLSGQGVNRETHAHAKTLTADERCLSRRNQMKAELTLIIFPRTLAPFGKAKRPENQFNQNHFAQLRLLSFTKPRNFDQKTSLEARPSRGALKAFFCGAS